MIIVLYHLSINRLNKLLGIVLDCVKHFVNILQSTEIRAKKRIKV